MQFKAKGLTDAEEYYKELHLTSAQRRKVRLVSKLATNYIPMSEHAMCGFAFRALKEYQVDNKIELSAFESMSADEKVTMLTDVMSRVKNQLLKILLKQEQTPTIDKAIVKLLDFYKNNLV
jgi:hypothetical protein